MNKFSKLLLIVALMCSASVVCSVYAINYYVGFSSNPSGVKYSGDVAGLKSALLAAGANDVVYIAKGTYYLDSQLIVKTHIIGGCNPAGDGSQEPIAIGAAGNLTSNMTVLDGNSLRHPLRSEKHRVATVNTGGIIENCLIRNGHARGTTNDTNDLNGHGGGVLLNGGKLYNCIIRGNVAMNVQYQSTNKSSGGGVYITNNGGEVVNCVIAFNMDDRGVGIDGKSGESINNTIAYNAMAPKWINIPGGNFQPYDGWSTTTQLTNRYITLSSFYMAETECTGGQFACFMAAIDLAGSSEPYSLTQADKNAMVVAKALVPTSYAGYPTGITVEQYALLSFNSAGSSSTVGTSMWNITSSHANNADNLRCGGCLSSDGSVNNRVWFPLSDKSASGTATSGTEARRRDNYPISLVSWYGSLAYSLWLGGCLPTEAQWEYAARRSTSGMNNTVYAGSDVIDDVAWYDQNSDLNGGNNSSTCRAHEVAKKDANGIGLFDMSGNLYEWILDPRGDYVAGGTTAITAGKNLVSGGNGNTGTTSGSRLQNPVALPTATGSYRV
ncbi:MAG: formylglycine-generating enzyme family protein [Bacteroidales bacterium]|jgi:formylglycine-generating enzyme required for sulfatase activity|nr:formylglycine-generating enzyme family protein [Bacteroidales bacterium]